MAPFSRIDHVRLALPAGGEGIPLRDARVIPAGSSGFTGTRCQYVAEAFGNRLEIVEDTAG